MAKAKRWRRDEFRAHYIRGGQSVNVRAAANEEFDELVIGEWFHLERMSLQGWWMCITTHEGKQMHINVKVLANGEVEYSHYEEGT